MTDAHLHLVVNHFPIIGIIFGFGILLSSLFLKNKSVQNTAYSIFIVAAIFAFASMYTGEGAEHMVEDMPNIGDKIIHQHEEYAEKLAIIAYLLGFVSIIGIYFNIKNKAQSKLISYVALTIAAVGLFLAQQTGTSGGEIRHTEIRNNSQSISNNNEINQETDED
jgi:uncharacterized membrane protein